LIAYPVDVVVQQVQGFFLADANALNVSANANRQQANRIFVGLETQPLIDDELRG
jgi:hypothetical protein